MKMYGCLIKVATFAMCPFILLTCKEKGTIDPIKVDNGTLLFQFIHLNNGKLLLFDTMIYKTSLGNHYMINDLQYFISGVQLHNANGKWIRISSDQGIHYTDARDQSTCIWKVTDPIPYGKYDSVTFIFGLDEKNNISYRFPDPPQRNMFWPEILGGGYHYMKMNLKWKDNSMIDPMPFMFHLGIGQIYKGDSVNTDSITGYVHNYFTVTSFVPLSIAENKVTQVNIIMNIEKWSDSQNAFDFSQYPMGIMQDQAGMQKACMNGRNAFVIK